MQKLYIVDTTLRDGEQAPGVAFTRAEKIEIAKGLDLLGVDMIEVGIAALGEDEIDAIRAIQQMDRNAALLIWNRMHLKDIDMSLQTGVENVHITVPGSDIHIDKKLGLSRETVIQRMQSTIAYARSHGLHVSVGAEDASRADFNFLKALYQSAEAAGAERVRYADTVGILNPFDTHAQISALIDVLSVPIDFHGHNDLGMGTANAFAAFKAGAAWISCSVNGLGERAGNTPLEEIVAAITFDGSVTSRIDKKRLNAISSLVAKYSGKAICDLKPIVGKQIFSHESGIHVDGLIKDSSVYEAVLPEDYGRAREIVLGKFSGRRAVRYQLKLWGVEIDDLKAQEIVNIIRKASYEQKLDRVQMDAMIRKLSMCVQ
ncbi:homoaconitate hydratase [Fusibacter paucivorans]|uniref:Homoaconitate hydratase n=1 Tax=Fusibacter paucivorans TaxID=76009 RepID=A0ABS5PM40_9FIRM|nr:homoaconitate hydratase [Fusibacter paucivorans]MBS7526260.1 homoaconitate hydratase [Fusibacter paucivorans]